MNTVLQYVLYLVILVALAVPLGFYIKRVMEGEKTFLSRILTPCEKGVYKLMRIKSDEQMTWKKYLVSVLIFSGIGFLFVFLLQLLQGFLPGNPQGLSGVSWDLSFNTAISFITNTNWQAYTGESTLSYLTQALGLTVQNFVSAATGIAVLYALIRGFTKVKDTGPVSYTHLCDTCDKSVPTIKKAINEINEKQELITKYRDGHKIVFKINLEELEQQFSNN